jgi:hypothetical protein
MHFIMLGKKASRFHNELRRQFPDSETKSQKSGAASDGDNKEIRDKLRRLLPSNIFVQILAGPPELRRGIFGKASLIQFKTSRLYEPERRAFSAASPIRTYVRRWLGMARSGMGPKSRNHFIRNRPTD